MFGGLALAGLTQWRRHRGTAAAWLATTLAVLALTVAFGNLLPERSAEPAAELARKLLVALIILIPWFLWRFTTTFVPATRAVSAVATGATALLAGGALLLPSIPSPGEPATGVTKGYIALVLVQWVGLSGIVTATLWNAGRDQPTVVRRRMQTLGLGALALALALATAGLSMEAGRSATTEVAVQVMSLLTPPLFLIGFTPPAVLRTIWRQPEEAALRAAVIRSVGARDPASIAEILLPRAACMVGGSSAVLADRHQRVLGAYGVEPAEAEAMAAGLGAHGEGLQTTPGGATIVVVPMGSATLLVVASRFAPFFGQSEIDRLRGLGALIDLALERMRNDEQIHDLNEELGARVRELEALNHELESFSYSVSHDLRAPLRAIDGFADLLLREDAVRQSAESRRYLDTIRRSTQQMGELIDDLLELARTGRQPLVRQHVEPAELARQALAGLAHEQAGRSLDVSVSDLPPCEADPVLLKQVFANLIANALKFTRGREPGVIEIGWRQESSPARTVYFVRDNGVGFDMRYANKLFGVFQRLHRQDDFEGAGVGLAIVQRIVHRHGGEVRAHGEVGAGACFEFFVGGAPAGIAHSDAARPADEMTLHDGSVEVRLP